MSEFENRPPGDRFCLNQAFLLFPSHRSWEPTIQGFEKLGPVYKSEITLSTDVLPDVCFYLELHPAPNVQFTEGISMPDPSHGYLITDDDYDPDPVKREAKIAQLQKLFPNRTISDLILHGNLVVNTDNAHLRKLGLTAEEHELDNNGGEYFPLTPETQSIFQRLRFVLLGPKNILSSQPYVPAYEVGELQFEDFYPAYLGPLPIRDKGIPAFLPVNPDLHHGVSGRFMLATEPIPQPGRPVIKIVAGAE